MTIDYVKRKLILGALKRSGGNRTVAAKKLGISVRGLRNCLDDYSSRGFEITQPQIATTMVSEKANRKKKGFWGDE